MDKFVSGAQCFVYVNNAWAKAVESIEFSENLNKRPLYGVLSTEIANMTEGSLEIQGNIMVFHDQTGEFESLLSVPRPNESPDINETLNRGIRELIRSDNTRSVLEIIDAASEDNLEAITYATKDALDRIAEEEEFIPTVATEVDHAFNKGILDPKTSSKPIKAIRIVYPDRHYEEFRDVWIMGRSKAIRNGARTGAQPLVNVYSFVARNLVRE